MAEWANGDGFWRWVVGLILAFTGSIIAALYVQISFKLTAIDDLRVNTAEMKIEVSDLHAEVADIQSAIKELQESHTRKGN